MGGPPAAVAQDAEDEADGAIFFLRDERDALANGLGEVRPGVLPALPEVVGLRKLGLELRPELADELLVVLRGGADGHR
jgi:hypothetical protein